MAEQAPVDGPDLTPQHNVDAFALAGEAMVGKLCATDCHGPERVWELRRTADDWAAIVLDMKGRGVVATTEQLALVERYLAWSFGYVAVNTAPADELAAVLGLPLEEAEAIVSYRETNGPLTGFDALLEVPGLDRVTLDAQFYALSFE